MKILLVFVLAYLIYGQYKITRNQAAARWIDQREGEIYDLLQEHDRRMIILEDRGRTPEYILERCVAGTTHVVPHYKEGVSAMTMKAQLKGLKHGHMSLDDIDDIHETLQRESAKTNYTI